MGMKCPLRSRLEGLRSVGKLPQRGPDDRRAPANSSFVQFPLKRVCDCEYFYRLKQYCPVKWLHLGAVFCQR